MRDVLLSDIDGVLADPLHRFSYAPDWTKFYEHVHKDKPIQSVIGMVRLLSSHYDVSFMTGRPEKVRPSTKAWLERHLGSVGRGALFMREDGDVSPSTGWKLSLCRDLKPTIVLEDDPGVGEVLVDAGFLVLCPMWDNAFPAACREVERLIRACPEGY